MATRVLVVIQQLLLAWLLAKDDFGLIGLAYTVTALVNLISNPGVDAILVQRPRAFLHWATPAFWLSMALGGVGALAMIGFAPLAAAAYDQPELVGLILVIAMATPFQAMQVVPKALLQIELRFRAIVLLGLTHSFLMTTLTVVAAYGGAGAYSFAIPMPIASALVAGLCWSMARPRVQFQPKAHLWKYLFRNSFAVGGARLLNAISNQADYVALGLIGLAEAAIGAYVFAFNIAIQPLRLLASNVPTVLFPGLSHLSLEPEKQVRAAIRATRLLALVTVPFCLLQVVLTEPAFHLLFPTRWLDAVLPCQILTLGLMVNSMAWPAHSLMMAQGRFHDLFRFNLISTLALVALLAVAGRTYPGTTSIALVVTIWHTGNSPLLYWTATHHYAMPGSFVRETFGPLACGVIAAGSSLFLQRVELNSSGDCLTTILLSGSSFTAIYSLLIYITWRSTLMDFLAQLAPHFPSFRSRPPRSSLE